MKFLSQQAVCALGLLAFLSGCARHAALSEEEVAQLHQSLFTIDTHVDVPRIEGAKDVDFLNAPRTQVTLEKMRAGGLDAAFFILFSQQGPLTDEGFAGAKKEALARYATIQRMLDRHSDKIALAYSATEARRIHDSGKLVAFLGMENGYPLAADPANLKEFYDLGVRYLGITHMGHNSLGDSSDPNKRAGDPDQLHGGLSKAGALMVAEANRLGIMVDVSHAHRDTALQLSEISRAPVIASHSAVQALSDVPRNMNDAQLLAVKESGGVVQVVAFDRYLKVAPPEKQEAVRALGKSVGLNAKNHNPNALPEEARIRYEEGRAEIEARWPGANVSTFVDHIDYAVGLIGIDHVGISSDFGGGGGIEGWNNASQTVNVTKELVNRGYSDEELEKLWGGNLLRVMSRVEEVAASLTQQ